MRRIATTARSIRPREAGVLHPPPR